MAGAGPLVDPLDLLLSNAEKDLHSFEQVLLRKEVAVPQDGQKALAKILQKVSQSARQAIREEASALGLNPQSDDKEALARRYQQFCVDLQELFLDYLRETDQAFFAPEIRWAIARVLKEMVPACKVVLRPCSQPVPRIQVFLNLERDLCRILFPEDPERLAGAADSPLFVFLSYPQIHARNPFFQTIIMSHEILHLRDEVRGLSRQLAGQVELKSVDFDALLQDLKRQPMLDATPSLPPVTIGERFGEDELRASISERWAKIISNWLAEITADLLAVRLFGPCYAVALADHSLANGVIDRDSDTHPCSRLRIGLILEELKQMGYGRHTTGVLGIASAQIRSIRELLAARPRRGANLLIYEKAKDYVHKARQRISERVRDDVGVDAYQAPAFHQEVGKLTELLEMGVPPGELLDLRAKTAEPAALRAIFNVAYTFQASRLDVLFDLLGAKTPESRIDSRSKLDELLLKAVELSEVSHAWKTAEKSGPEG